MVHSDAKCSDSVPHTRSHAAPLPGLLSMVHMPASEHQVRHLEGWEMRKSASCEALPLRSPPVDSISQPGPAETALAVSLPACRDRIQRPLDIHL